MTQLDVKYRYSALPSEATIRAFGRLREIYGIRHTQFSEAERTVRIEYDASRLSEPLILQLLRRTGLDVTERISLVPPQVQPEAAVPAAG